MKLSVYHDPDVGVPTKQVKNTIHSERWSWVEYLRNPLPETTSPDCHDPTDGRRTPLSVTSHLSPILASHPNLALTPTVRLKAWTRHVHAFCESEKMLVLQESTLDYNCNKSQALAALNAARVMVHNVYGFTGRRAELAKTTMYLYQTTLLHVVRVVQTAHSSHSVRLRPHAIMGDTDFHLALITVCLEVSAFVYREDDGRFSHGFPLLTNTVQQAREPRDSCDASPSAKHL